MARGKESRFNGGYKEERKKRAKTENADFGCIFDEEMKRGAETE